MTAVLNQLLGIVVPVIVAALTTFGFEWLQKANAWLNRQDAVLKRILVAVISALLTIAASKLGVALGDASLGGLTQSDLSGLISAALSFIFHLGDQAKANNAALMAAKK
jgi:uncharacterized membrane protein